jgi:hypothetical protein
VGFIRAEDLDALCTPNNFAGSLDEVWAPQAGAGPQKTQAMAAWSEALLDAFKAAGGIYLTCSFSYLRFLTIHLRS